MAAPAEPLNLDAFYRKHHSFVWGPALAAAGTYAVTKLPKVAAYLDKNSMTPWGMEAVHYVAFAVAVAYGVHGFCVVHATPDKQIQSFDPKNKYKEHANKEEAITPMKTYAERENTQGAAVRTVAALMTSLVYYVVPFAPVSQSWGAFLGWLVALSLYWDAHFFVAHKYAHEIAPLYKWMHKKHHERKQPDCFSAYYVTYQSHFILEQAVVLMFAFAGLPVDVFRWTLYYGTLDTYLKHSGYEFGDMKLPVLPLTFSQLSTILGFYGLPFGFETPGQHDWHHEKFFANYALSFTYLDRLFGSYHPGRVPGQVLKDHEAEIAKRVEADIAKRELEAAKAILDEIPELKGSPKSASGADSPKSEESTAETESVPARATYTKLSEATVADFEVQGKAFDEYRESGQIVYNVRIAYRRRSNCGNRRRRNHCSRRRAIGPIGPQSSPNALS